MAKIFFSENVVKLQKVVKNYFIFAAGLKADT